MPELHLRKTRGLVGANAFNQVAQAVRSLSSFTVAGESVDAAGLPGGRAIRAGRTGLLYAKITSGSNPYSWLPAARTAGGWITCGSGGTTSLFPAYEINNRTDVPSGHIVELYPGSGGDLRFHVVRWGGCGNSTNLCVVDCAGNPLAGADIAITTTSDGSPVASVTTDSGGCYQAAAIAAGRYNATVTSGGAVVFDRTIDIAGCSYAFDECCRTIRVLGCFGLPIAGASVAIQDGAGATVSSGSTDSNGDVTLTVPAPGTYTVNVTGVDKYQDLSASETFTCPGPGTGTPTVVAMTPASGWVCGCVGPESSETDPSTGCVIMPATLVASDGLGSVTLTYSEYDPVAGGAGWGGCATRTFYNIIVCYYNEADQQWETECASSVVLPVYFFFSCGGGGQGGGCIGGSGVGWWMRVFALQSLECSAPGPAGIGCLPTVPYTAANVVIDLGTDNTCCATSCDPFNWTCTSDYTHEGCPDNGRCEINTCCEYPCNRCGVYNCQTVNFVVTE